MLNTDRYNDFCSGHAAEIMAGLSDHPITQYMYEGANLPPDSELIGLVIAEAIAKTIGDDAEAKPLPIKSLEVVRKEGYSDIKTSTTHHTFTHHQSEEGPQFIETVTGQDQPEGQRTWWAYKSETGGCISKPASKIKSATNLPNGNSLRTAIEESRFESGYAIWERPEQSDESRISYFYQVKDDSTNTPLREGQYDTKRQNASWTFTGLTYEQEGPISPLLVGEKKEKNKHVAKLIQRLEGNKLEMAMQLAASTILVDITRDPATGLITQITRRDLRFGDEYTTYDFKYTA